MKYRREIDGLRALAVLPVIFYHAGFELFGGGYLGVDVFFVLSGYLITSIIVEEQSTGSFSILRFYERRARRILPALLLILIACLPAAWFLLVPAASKEFSQSLLAVLGFLSNIFFWRDTGYFNTASELKPLLHTWSLAVEEQFYLFYPLFLIVVSRLENFRKALIIALVAVCSLILAQWQVFARPSAAFFLLPTRAWELLLGALVANYLCIGTTQAPPRWFREIGSVIGLLMLVMSVLFFTQNTPNPGFLTLVPTAGTCLMILWATPATLVGRLLGSRWPVGIGLLSYSAYLWHQPLFAFTRHALLGNPTPELMLALSILAILLAYGTWILVERPFRNKESVTRSNLIKTTLFATVFLACFGIADVASDGFRNLKVSPTAAKILASAIPSPLRDRCHYRDAERHPSVPCEYHVSPATWAVLGDSHAVELSFALANLLQSRGQGLIHYSRSDCAPLDSQGDQLDECQQWTKSAISSILANPNITTVVLSYRMNYYLFGDHEGTYPDHPDQYSDILRSGRWTAFHRAVKTLLDRGKRVIYVMQAPELPKSIEYLTLMTEISPTEDVNGVSRKWWNERTQYLQDKLQSLPDSVLLIDPAAAFCDNKNCYAARHGTALYFDDDHMSVAGASIIASEIDQGAVSLHR